MTEWVLRGVPGALAMDAWWLGDTMPPPQADRSEAKLVPARGVLVLLALVGIGDGHHQTATVMQSDTLRGQ
jgi:hypothetical protein